MVFRFLEFFPPGKFRWFKSGDQPFAWPVAEAGVLALGLGFLAEWQFAPFIRDASIGYFVTHIHQLKPITLIMIAAGGFIGFWAPFSRRGIERRS